MILELYAGVFLATQPVSKTTPKKLDRNSEICARHQAGESLSTLAEVFGISEQRIHQIIHGRRK